MLVGVPNIAREFGVCEEAVRVWIRKGWIRPEARLGQMCVFDLETVRRQIAANRRRQGRPKK